MAKSARKRAVGTNRFKPNYAKSKKARKPLWTPTSGITQSGLSKFLDCPEQFALSYVEGVTSKRISEPLEFGNLFHLCCEFQGKKSPEVVAADCGKAYIKSRQGSIDHSEYDKLQKLVGLVKIVFTRYVKYWAAKDKAIRWISREKPFSVPYTFTDGNGKPTSINLIGKRDGVYNDSKSNLCLFETKTKSQINSAEITDGLRGDFQTLFYLLCLEIELKRSPREVLYNVIRRPGQRYSKGSNLQAFLAKVAADIDKRPKHYFARWRVTLTQGSLARFRQVTLDPTLRNLVSWWGSIQQRPFDRFQSPSHHLNLPALTSGRYGRSDLYDLIIKGQRSGYFNRTTLFPELNESIKAA